MINSVKKIMKPLWDEFPKRISKEPHNRLVFKDSGIDVTSDFLLDKFTFRIFPMHPNISYTSDEEGLS